VEILVKARGPKTVSRRLRMSRTIFFSGVSRKFVRSEFLDACLHQRHAVVHRCSLESRKRCASISFFLLAGKVDGAYMAKADAITGRQNGDDGRE